MLSSDFAGSILIVRRDNIGDLVCTTPLIAALRAACPHARIEALVNSYNAPVLFGNPALDAVNTYTKLKHSVAETTLLGAVAARLGLIRRLRAKKFDLAILARSGFDRHGLGFVRWLGIPQIAGFAPSGKIPAALTRPVAQVDNEALHEVETIACLARALGIADATGPLQVYPDSQRLSAIKARFGANGPIVAVHISARESSRRLPEEKWVAAIHGIARQRPETLFALFWSPGTEGDPRHPGDDEKARRILAALTGSRVIACPTSELDELIAGVACCSAFIGADGGALHIAAAAGRPCVSLFENSAFKRRHWAPWRVPHVIVTPPTFAIGDIDSDQIVQSFLSLTPEQAA